MGFVSLILIVESDGISNQDKHIRIRLNSQEIYIMQIEKTGKIWRNISFDPKSDGDLPRFKGKLEKVCGGFYEYSRERDDLFFIKDETFTPVESLEDIPVGGNIYIVKFSKNGILKKRLSNSNAEIDRILETQFKPYYRSYEDNLEQKVDRLISENERLKKEKNSFSPNERKSRNRSFVEKNRRNLKSQHDTSSEIDMSFEYPMNNPIRQNSIKNIQKSKSSLDIRRENSFCNERSDQDTTNQNRRYSDYDYNSRCYEAKSPADNDSESAQSKSSVMTHRYVPVKKNENTNMNDQVMVHESYSPQTSRKAKHRLPMVKQESNSGFHIVSSSTGRNIQNEIMGSPQNDMQRLQNEMQSSRIDVISPNNEVRTLIDIRNPYNEMRSPHIEIRGPHNEIRSPRNEMISHKYPQDEFVRNPQKEKVHQELLNHFKNKKKNDYEEPAPEIRHRHHKRNKSNRRSTSHNYDIPGDNVTIESCSSNASSRRNSPKGYREVYVMNPAYKKMEAERLERKMEEELMPVPSVAAAMAVPENDFEHHNQQQQLQHKRPSRKANRHQSEGIQQVQRIPINDLEQYLYRKKLQNQNFLKPNISKNANVQNDLMDISEADEVIRDPTPILQPHSPNLQPHSPNLQSRTPSLQPHSPSLQPHSQNLQPHSQNLQPHSQNLQPHSQNLQPHSPILQPHSPILEPHSPYNQYSGCNEFSPQSTYSYIPPISENEAYQRLGVKKLVSLFNDKSF